MHWIWVWEHSKHFPYKFMVIASLFYSISAYERFHENALISDSGENLYFPGNDDYCWGWREYYQYQQCRWVSFQALGRDLFCFEGDDKKSLWYFFSHFFFCLCVHRNRFLSCFQVLVNANIQKNMCFYGMYTYYSGIFFKFIIFRYALNYFFFKTNIFLHVLWLPP